MINPPLLEQALVNLVDNAVKFSENDSEVTIGVKEENGNVVISVLDQGYGIDQTHLPRIFERFYRIDKGRSRKQGGTGLGLAIVKHIAQAHGGHVSVESTIGKGSNFSIHLTR
jgi:two-component system phosphate regulon sensor histidine kinase PhoR